MSTSSSEKTTQEKIVQDKFNQSKSFNQSLKELWNEIKEDAKYDLL